MMAGNTERRSARERNVSPPSRSVALKRAALAKAKGHAVLHLPKGHLVIVIPELTNSSRASVDVRVQGKVVRS